MPTLIAKPSFGSKFAWLRPSRSHPLARYVGIDIGVETVRVATLGTRHRDRPALSQRKHRSLRWLSSHEFSLPIDALASPPSDWVDRVIATLTQRLPRLVDGDQNLCVVSLPLSWIHYQVVPAAEIELSRRQCDAMFLSSLFQSQSHLGYWPLKESGSATPEDPYVLVAVAESAAYDLAEAIGSLGYQIQSIMPHGVSLLAASAAMTGIDPQCIVLLQRNGGMIAVKNRWGCGLCRLLPSIPNHVLAQSRAGGLTLDAIRPWLSDVAEEITATRRYVRRMQDTFANAPIVLCGEIASIAGVDERVATLLDGPVARWRYTGKSRPGDQLPASPTSVAEDAAWAMSLSLAYSAARSVAAPRTGAGAGEAKPRKSADQGGEGK